MNPTTAHTIAIAAPGFDDPTRDSQRAFRAILNALAHPTRAFQIDGPNESLPTLGPALAAAALTLFDEESPVALTGRFAEDPSVRSWLAFHTGAGFVSRIEEASFVLTDPSTMPKLADLALGSDEAPHLSATVLIDTRGCVGAKGFTAAGPGIDGSATLRAAWSSSDFLTQWQHNASLFPCGVDLLLVDEHAVTGLPRTTRLTDTVSLPTDTRQEN